MTKHVLEVVQSLEKGGRTTRFKDTVDGLRENGVTVAVLCLSSPAEWVEIEGLEVIQKQAGKNFSLVFHAWKFLKANKITLVHAHCEFSQLHVGLAAKLLGIPVVATFHRSDLDCYKPSIVNNLIKWCAQAYVAVSKDRVSLLTDNLSFPSDKCHVVHGGTHITSQPSESEIALARKHFNIDEQQFCLLSMGHLGPIKGHQDTLNALAKITQKQTDFNGHLYIAGDGSAEEKRVIESIVKEHNLNSFVTFLGQTHEANLWMTACDVFIQPSVEEAFGLVFIEAGAKGKPVIATAVGGIKDIVLNQETGILVPTKSPTPLANAIMELWQSPEKRLQYGRDGFDRINNHFSKANMVEQYLEIFERIS
jgi:glycosyltransferase involved in cell wall biosynthesis